MSSPSKVPSRIVVTGGLGFIGSAVVRSLIDETDFTVLNVDVGTYAATTGSVASVAGSDRYQHEAIDITHREPLRSAFERFQPDAVIHLAAETHVDRSIDSPASFINTNVLGTFELLSASLDYTTAKGTIEDFRFVHVSTDEVFGSLTRDAPAFTEISPYLPRSPYSASKAAADHLVNAWHETYGLATVVTNCSNNFGPFQFPEKLIPLMITKAAADDSLPVYGSGDNIRDWLFVDDHARGLITALEAGIPGETYLFGGDAERSNLEVVELLCDIVDDELGRRAGGRPRRDLIELVADRPGHDFRYAVDAARTETELAWHPTLNFEKRVVETVRWYLANERWWRPLLDERYDGSRLGEIE